MGNRTCTICNKALSDSTFSNGGKKKCRRCEPSFNDFLYMWDNNGELPNLSQKARTRVKPVPKDYNSSIGIRVDKILSEKFKALCLYNGVSYHDIGNQIIAKWMCEKMNDIPVLQDFEVV